MGDGKRTSDSLRLKVGGGERVDARYAGAEDGRDFRFPRLPYPWLEKASIQVPRG